MTRLLAWLGVAAAALTGFVFADDAKPPVEKTIAGPAGVKIVVRMQGPYDADVPLQAVCYFKHRDAGDKTNGAPVELDKRLRGLISSLRDRGEFVGDELETLLIVSPPDSIKPQALLLVGLGDESRLSLETMERVGRVVVREAARLGAKRVAFAPLLRDQGNSTLAVGEVETAVLRGVLTAYDTERRLQSAGLAKTYQLDEWVVEAGPAFFDETVFGVAKGIAAAKETTDARPTSVYAGKE